MQSETVFLYNSGSRADCYSGAGTHLEFERLMPKGANFAPAPSPPVILAAQSNYVSRIFVFRFAVLNLLLVLEKTVPEQKI